MGETTEEELTIERDTTFCRNEIEEDFKNIHLYGKLSYATACKLCFESMILCNNIVEVDNSVYDNLQYDRGEDEDEDNYEEPEVFQWYLVDVNEYFFEKYKNAFLMSYSDALDCHVLAVDHFGTSWRYVPTDIKIEDMKEA